MADKKEGRLVLTYMETFSGTKAEKTARISKLFKNLSPTIVQAARLAKKGGRTEVGFVKIEFKKAKAV